MRLRAVIDGKVKWLKDWLLGIPIFRGWGQNHEETKKMKKAVSRDVRGWVDVWN